jgi:2Fe-2S ferredoxin
MTKVTYVQPDGSQDVIEVSPGVTVMQAAVSNSVNGIVAECGGSAMCATCHVYFDPSSVDLVPPIADVEIEMIESAASERKETSRLSCQLVMSEEIKEFVVHIPSHQV